MKLIQSLLLFCFCAALTSSCFDPPELPVQPQIEFRSLTFKEIGTSVDFDSLVLVISFKDGDGDLGLNATANNSPHNQYNFFIDVGNQIVSSSDVETLTPDMKVTRLRSRKKPGLENKVPDFTSPANCLNYYIGQIYIPENQQSLIDDSYDATDTIADGNLYYVVSDTFYIERNKNYYNIDVSFWIRDDGSITDPLAEREDGFVKLNWETLYEYPRCGETFNGRFPVLSRKGKASPMEGDIRYSMNSSGFKPILGNKPFRLKVQIRDRALNESNVITTPVKTLLELRR